MSRTDMVPLSEAVNMKVADAIVTGMNRVLSSSPALRASNLAERSYAMAAMLAQNLLRLEPRDRPAGMQAIFNMIEQELAAYERDIATREGGNA